MNPSDVVKYIGQLLNIDTSNPIVMQDIMEDLKEVQDLNAFRIFIKEKFNYERFKYLTGFQKFVALKTEFMKENKPKLTADQMLKVSSTAEDIFQLTTSIFDEIDFRVKAGMDIEDPKIKTYLYLSFEKIEESKRKKYLRVLKKIGDKQDILNFMRRDRQGLLEEIKNIIHGFTLVKAYPNLAVENKSQDKLMIEILKGK